MKKSKQFFRSKPAFLGLFALLTMLLAIPLIVLLAQEKQDSRQFADQPAIEISNTPNNVRPE